MHLLFPSGNYFLDVGLDLSSVKSSKFVIYIPGMNFRFEEIDWLSDWFVNAGYNFVRFGFRYHKDGNRIDDFSLDNDLEDIKNLINFLDAQGYGIDSIGIVAKSFGGIKGFLFDDKRLKVCGFIAPATFFGDVSTIENLKKQSYGSIDRITKFVLSNAILKKWNIPTLMLHGDNDKNIPFENSVSIFENMSCEKFLVSIPGMGHSPHSDEERNLVGSSLVNFFEKYL